MKTRRPAFLTIHIILLIIASVLTLFSAKFVVEGEAKTQDMEKSFGKTKEKVNAPTLKKNKKNPTNTRLRGNSALATKTNKKPTKKAETPKNNLLAEYQVIVDKNLFRPLGWGGEKPNNPFRLVGTVIDSSSQKAKAIITQGENPEIFFVSEGDIIGNGYKVEEISANKVKLANTEKGENLVIQFDWTPLGGQPSRENSRGNSGRLESESTGSRAENRNPSANRGKGQSRDGRKSTGEREYSKREIEAWTQLKQSSAWQNASPEEQKQMAQEMESKLGDKDESSDSDDDK